MKSISKYFIGGLFTLGLIIAGFCFSIRSCLSKYDLRYALPPVLYFGKGDTAILFSLVKFSKTTSYSQEGGFISKTYNTDYLIQCNRASTGEKIADKKIHGNDRIKHFPETVIGAAGNEAWIFLDELMSFDAFTLQKKTDAATIETRNPALKGKLPAESQYYHFNDSDKSINFTANDGSLWLLNTKTLFAIEQQPAAKEVVNVHAMASRQRFNNLQRMNIFFNDMAINQDTSNGLWFGIYSKEELTKKNENIPPMKAYGQDERRLFISSTYINDNNDNFMIDKTNAQISSTETFFLDGGLLLNKETGKVIQLSNPQSYLVVYKNQVGNDGKIILGRVAQNGKLFWKMNTNLPTWTDWKYKDDHIFIFGTNSSGLSNSECSLVLSINVGSGETKQYDYLNDKAGIFDNK